MSNALAPNNNRSLPALAKDWGHAIVHEAPKTGQSLARAALALGCTLGPVVLTSEVSKNEWSDLSIITLLASGVVTALYRLGTKLEEQKEQKEQREQNELTRGEVTAEAGSLSFPPPQGQLALPAPDQDSGPT